MYIADELLIVNMMGIRWVTKIDGVYIEKTGATHKYYLEIQYKGSSRQIGYKDQAARDNMFDRISTALTAKKNPAIIPQL